MRVRRVAAASLEAAQLVVERGSLPGEFLDAFLRGGDDGVGGVVVFFEAKALPQQQTSLMGVLEGNSPVYRGDSNAMLNTGSQAP